MAKDNADLLSLSSGILQTARNVLDEIGKQKDEIEKQKAEIEKQKADIERQAGDLREQSKQAQAMMRAMQDLRKEMMGFDDAARLLVEALEVWAQSEPQRMWEETRKQMQDARTYLTKAEKYWSDDTRRQWILDITNDVQAGLSQHIIEHRESVLKRANRSIIEMKTESTYLQNYVQDFLNEAIANTEQHINENVDRSIRKIEVTLSDYLRDLRESLQAMIAHRDAEIMKECMGEIHGHD
ncbi:hypothetical protein HFQ13_10725 [Acidithiobacillus sp. VAN18-1]|uniref:Uncharacterized protein n=1 Tax=Igneacidithiobacillus copahuensis TaxID=2724909 RepID=A0AAE2YR40_9PROT|nr:hypothetical protein [Igneacidithiobacillus copahuensis]MBU2788665.1 hypothetical protein [Igneacidithiobacillus copahuensis]MBU2796651.1 hypothetical protein [Acidithiobacillus sp. VAN18-2]